MRPQPNGKIHSPIVKQLLRGVRNFLLQSQGVHFNVSFTFMSQMVTDFYAMVNICTYPSLCKFSCKISRGGKLRFLIISGQYGPDCGTSQVGKMLLLILIQRTIINKTKKYEVSVNSGHHTVHPIKVLA